MRTVATLLAATVVAAAVPMGSAAEAQHRHYQERYEYRCHKHGGTTGAVVGGVAGGLLGHAVLGGTAGTLVGAGGGALGGRAIERTSNKRNCR